MSVKVQKVDGDQIKVVSQLKKAHRALAFKLDTLKRPSNASKGIMYALQSLEVAGQSLRSYEERIYYASKRLELYEGSVGKHEAKLADKVARKHCARAIANVQSTVIFQKNAIIDDRIMIAMSDTSMFKAREEGARDALMKAVSIWALPTKQEIDAVEAECLAAYTAYMNERKKLTAVEKEAVDSA